MAAATTDPTPDGALRRLLAGNRRFYTGHLRHPHQGLADLHDLATGQHPFAITIGCADSRVSPEVILDQRATAPGHIGTIVDALRPTVEPLLNSPGNATELAVVANVRAKRRRSPPAASCSPNTCTPAS